MLTDSVDRLASFPTSTHTHIFGNHRNGYGHLKTADVRSFVDCRKSDSLTASQLGFNSRNDENYDFKIVILLSQLGSLMICTHDLYALTKRKKKRFAIANRSDTVAKALSINISIVLTELVYLQKMDQTSPSWGFH
jgi:hypothetical protein